MKNKKSNTALQIIQKIFLLAISSVLFWLSNPNIYFNDGLSFLAWLNYLPVLFLIKNTKLSDSWIWGGFYGAISYGLYGYWLKTFHPLGLAIVCVGYFLICAFLFFILKSVELLFKKNSWLVQFLCVCGYEYLKTLGFFGISYGVTAYTQWQNIHLIQICSVVGVFGFNLLVIFPSSFFYSLITKKITRERLLNQADDGKHSHISAYVKKEQVLWQNSLTSTYICGGIWLVLMALTLCFGFSSASKNQYEKTVSVAAIQNNESPWKNGIEEYSRNVKKLIHLTEEAQALSPDVDFIVWPETAVAPSIIYNYDYGTDVRRFMLISQLLNFIDENNAVFVIGNSHEVDVQHSDRARYNSALIFESGKNVHPPEPGIYSKIKLVPFTEHFPAKHLFPSLYVKLLNGDSHMWEKGDEYTVFDYRGLKFSTPICFEDTFSTVCRQMVLNGSRCFINLSNDSWSKSIPCQKQHLAMAVFRSVENGVPTVRSTASGVSCIINPHGKVDRVAPEFCEAFVIGKVPVIEEGMQTPFTRYGDWAGIAEAVLSCFILIMQTFIVIIKKIKN